MENGFKGAKWMVRAWKEVQNPQGHLGSPGGDERVGKQGGFQEGAPDLCFGDKS